MKRARLLRKIRISEVSSVDHAASPGARVMLMKRDGHVGRPTNPEGDGHRMVTLKALKKAAKAARQVDPERIAKREAKTARKVDKAVARIQKTNPSTTPAAAFLRFARDPENAELWAEYKKLGGGPSLPWQGPNTDINQVRSAPIPIIPVRPSPILTIATGGTPSLEDLVAEAMRLNPAMGRPRATAAVLRTPAGAAAYRAERAERLARAATAAGVGAARV